MSMKIIVSYPQEINRREARGKTGKAVGKEKEHNEGPKRM